NPAPLLKHVRLDADEVQPLFDRLLYNIALCLLNERVHGDLSAYNILYWEGDVILIDFAQAVDPRTNPEASALLARDIERVCQIFTPYGIDASPAALTED